jgi:saccharopine dehydrogenase (NADP+, L-glutamate forming)/spermidine synthase
MKNVLVLGAGLVAGPLVGHLLDQPDYRVRVATRTVSKAEKIVGENPRGEALSINISDTGALEKLIKWADLVVSMVPYTHHPAVARLCIKHGKNFVTTSYVSDAMRALDEEAKKAGVILLNEVGLDPGIDHMSAMRIIHKIKDSGGEVESFTSFCGGLPAPDANDNPFGYKFSWSPRGVMLAGKREAQYLKNGGIVRVAPEDLFKEYWMVDIEGLGTFESYPNGNSLPYIETYGIPETQVLLRGTYRYPGWCETWVAIKKLNLLDETEKVFSGLTYAQLTASLVGGKAESVKSDLAKFLGLPEDSEIIGRLEWLGLLSDEKLPVEKGSPLDVIAARLLEKLVYAPGERDMIILRHNFVAKYADRSGSGKRREKIVSTFIGYGVAGSSEATLEKSASGTAMAKTVGLPAAIASVLVLEGKITETGVHIPVTPDIYEPILDELETVGIAFKEESSSIP